MLMLGYTPKHSLHFQILHPCNPSRSLFKRFVVASSSAVKTAKSSTPSKCNSTLYQILSVKENASSSEIKAAYRRLAKRYHPDAASKSEAADDFKSCWDFIEIHEAYSTLTDPVARAQYDTSIGSSRYQFRHSAIFPRFQTRRWETDQCW